MTKKNEEILLNDLLTLGEFGFIGKYIKKDPVFDGVTIWGIVDSIIKRDLANKFLFTELPDPNSFDLKTLFPIIFEIHRQQYCCYKFNEKTGYLRIFMTPKIEEAVFYYIQRLLYSCDYIAKDFYGPPIMLEPKEYSEKNLIKRDRKLSSSEEEKVIALGTASENEKIIFEDLISLGVEGFIKKYLRQIYDGIWEEHKIPKNVSISGVTKLIMESGLVKNFISESLPEIYSTVKKKSIFPMIIFEKDLNQYGVYDCEDRGTYFRYLLTPKLEEAIFSYIKILFFLVSYSYPDK